MSIIQMKSGTITRNRVRPGSVQLVNLSIKGEKEKPIADRNRNLSSSLMAPASM